MKARTTITKLFRSLDSVSEALKCGFQVLDSRTLEPITDADLEQLSTSDLHHLEMRIG
ncbi:MULTISPECIES: hypothetical protein [unclassified Thioalkalivibrio]|uniref:hypothetical protein n=1 Tax=unclassified Thioalkalivibrio TaxID=2621013 RepID=UPI00036FDC54|nr:MULTISPECIES: hypothetical protein [unclassified Thioalkalivibrio]